MFSCFVGIVEFALRELFKFSCVYCCSRLVCIVIVVLCELLFRCLVCIVVVVFVYCCSCLA